MSLRKRHPIGISRQSIIYTNFYLEVIIRFTDERRFFYNFILVSVKFILYIIFYFNGFVFEYVVLYLFLFNKKQTKDFFSYKILIK